MAPAKKPWFRLYTETFTDPKIRRLNVTGRWLWITVLAAARQSPIPGYLMLTLRENFTDADLAEMAGVKLKEAREGLAAMERIGLIEEDSDIGAFFVSSWNNRQYQSDDTTARTRKHRQRTVDGTFHQRPSNGDGTHQKTETDTDTENTHTSQDNTQPADTRNAETNSAARGNPINDDFEAWWERYPRKIAKADAKARYAKARKKPQVTAQILTDRLDAAVACWRRERRPADKIPHASTWLNQERWQDDYDTQTDPERHASRQRGIAKWAEVLAAKGATA